MIIIIITITIIVTSKINHNIYICIKTNVFFNTSAISLIPSAFPSSLYANLLVAPTLLSNLEGRRWLSGM